MPSHPYHHHCAFCRPSIRSLAPSRACWLSSRSHARARARAPRSVFCFSFFGPSFFPDDDEDGGEKPHCAMNRGKEKTGPQQQQQQQQRPKPIMCWLAREMGKRLVEAAAEGKNPLLNCPECDKRSVSLVHCAICTYYACKDCFPPASNAAAVPCPRCLKAAAAVAAAQQEERKQN